MRNSQYGVEEGLAVQALGVLPTVISLTYEL